MLRRVALVRTDVSEELSASFITVTRIGELGATLAVTSNRRTLRRATRRNIPEDAILKESLRFCTAAVLYDLCTGLQGSQLPISALQLVSLLVICTCAVISCKQMPDVLYGAVKTPVYLQGQDRP
jgi:hypothetical protein